MLALWLCICLYLVDSRAEMEGFIVGGAYAKIKKHPHAAFLSVRCVNQEGRNVQWVCGSSIINQRILLTAAHCLADCSSNTHIIVHLGNENRKNGTLRSTNGFIIHAHYDDDSCAHDIALIRMSRPLKLNSRIRRVAIMKKPPYSEPAKVSGWGLTNVEHQIFENKLKILDQHVWKYVLCKKKYHDMPDGTICASSNNSNNYAAPGDSGSGLVVRGYIQIGLVSYKVSSKAKNVIIYTDVGYYYNWIVYNTPRLYCFTNVFRWTNSFP